MRMSSAVALTPLGPASMLVGVELLTSSGGTKEFCLDVCLVIGGVLRGLELVFGFLCIFLDDSNLQVSSDRSVVGVGLGACSFEGEAGC